MYALHVIQNEFRHGEVVVFNLGTFFTLFCYIKNNHLILKQDRHAYDTIDAFLRFISLNAAYAIEDWNEEGRGYTIRPPSSTTDTAQSAGLLMAIA
jgi:hypothetical protein